MIVSWIPTAIVFPCIFLITWSALIDLFYACVFKSPVVEHTCVWFTFCHVLFLSLFCTPYTYDTYLSLQVFCLFVCLFFCFFTVRNLHVFCIHPSIYLPILIINNRYDRCMFVYIVWFRQCSFVNKVSLVQCVICKPYLLLYILWPKKKKVHCLQNSQFITLSISVFYV